MTTQPQILDRETVLAELDLLLTAVTLAEDHLLRKQQARDAGIITARRAGVSAIDLAARTGLSIQRVYQILAEYAEEET
jgi:hypothetical protein